ncbi:hypothetical protein [Actinocorallia populi]|uniref:hypothetical protein n=1 Tax=Actinocorallia populi TaxID=2079200 RepID=UPI001300BE59|nr:hypothetical protein [Actinocorallia populi]
MIAPLSVRLVGAAVPGRGGFAAFGSHLDGEATIPGSQSQQGIDLLERSLPEATGVTAQLVFAAPSGETVDDPAHRTRIQKAVREVVAAPQVAEATGPFQTGAVSADRRTAEVALGQCGRGVFIAAWALGNPYGGGPGSSGQTRQHHHPQLLAVHRSSPVDVRREAMFFGDRLVLGRVSSALPPRLSGPSFSGGRQGSRPIPPGGPAAWLEGFGVFGRVGRVAG